MKNDFSKLRLQQHQTGESTSLHQSQQAHAREFTSVEEMMRADRENTGVPPRLAVRLNDSIQKEPKPARSRWRRLFG